LYVDIGCHFKSVEKIIKLKASLGPQWKIGIAVGQETPK